MVTRPSSQTFERLLAFAREHGSFDGGLFFSPNFDRSSTYHLHESIGGDQGVLNDYFPHWHRLPFGFNMTPGAVYSNAPAYQRYKDQISIVHFAGTGNFFAVLHC